MIKFFRLKKYLKVLGKPVGDISVEQLEKVSGIAVKKHMITPRIKRYFKYCGYNVFYSDVLDRLVYSKSKYKNSFCSEELH